MYYYVSEQVFSSEEMQLNHLSQFLCKLKKFFNKGFSFFERTIFSDICKDFLGFAGDAKAHEGLENSQMRREIHVQSESREQVEQLCQRCSIFTCHLPVAPGHV